MKVIDNFISSEQFHSIQSIMLGPNFSWNYSDGIVGPDDPPGTFQFNHTFYCAHGVTPCPEKVIQSSWLSILDPVVKKLGDKMWRIKANMGPRTHEIRRNKFHIDFPNIITAVYYINTNNGWTEFKNGGKVKSVANRMIMFDTTLSHRGVSCTDEKRRMVVNFNWE